MIVAKINIEVQFCLIKSYKFYITETLIVETLRIKF